MAFNIGMCALTTSTYAFHFPSFFGTLATLRLSTISFICNTEVDGFETLQKTPSKTPETVGKYKAGEIIMTGKNNGVAKTYYLATVEGDQPRVRPFGTVHISEGKQKLINCIK